MDIQEIKQQIADFKAIKAKGSITPDSLGSLLENMLEVLADSIDNVERSVSGKDISGIAVQGNFYCPVRIENAIKTTGSSGYLLVNSEVIHLKKGQTLKASEYKLPGILFFIDKLEEGAHTLGMWQTNSAYMINYTAPKDVDVVIALSDGSNTIQQVAYTITVPGILPRIEIVENTLNDAAVLRVSLAVTHILQVNVFDSKTKFVQDDSLADVLDNMEHLQDLRLAIQVNYASGLKVLFHATSVKPNYISLHAKAGSCELHLASDGSFTIAGTSLW